MTATRVIEGLFTIRRASRTLLLFESEAVFIEPEVAGVGLDCVVDILRVTSTFG